MGELVKKSLRFEQIFYNSGVGIFVVDRDRIIIEANETFYKIFGYKNSEVIGQSALILHKTKETYLHFANIAFNKVIKNQALFLEYEFKHKKGNPIWLRISGDPIPTQEEVLWIITDITDRISAEQKLKETERLLVNAEEIAHLGSWEMDLGKTKIKASKEVFNIFGIKTKKFKSNYNEITEYISKKSIATFKKISNQALRYKTKQTKEIEILKGCGEKAFVQIQAKPLADPKNNKDKITGTFLDITKQKTDEQKIKTLNEKLNQEVQLQLEIIRKKDEQLQHQSRLVQMGEMLNMIAHQWRQPLSAISATTSLLTAKIMLNNYEKEIFLEEMGRVEKYTQLLSTTIDDFRNFFSTTKEKEAVTLKELVETTLNILKPILQSQSIKVTTLYGSKETLSLYKNELCQVILNILKNSQDSFVEKKIKNPHIFIQTYEEDNFLCIKIEDNAGGINKNNIDKIFDLYFSTKSHKHGTGIGLYMSKIIVEDHCGGKIDVKSSQNKSTFYIKLPK